MADYMGDKEVENMFTLAPKTEEMIIVSFDKLKISLKDILNRTQNCNEECVLNFGNINLKINYIDEISISFTICGKKGYCILRTPLKVTISEKEIELVCKEQLEFYLKEYKNPRIQCSCGKRTDVTIRYIHSHINHNFAIIDSEEIKELSEIELELTISKIKNRFLKKIFSSPQEFEKNFNYYFRLRENGNELNGNFNIFDDDKSTRNFIVVEFTLKEFGKKFNYFGASGKGKSITLIGALKYSVSHIEIGTLYVNCKTLKVLFEKHQFKLITRILTDEIVFLFYKDYDGYQRCFKKIKSFNFLSNTSFWPLIDSILEECSCSNKNHIIGFDQYNESIDLEKQLDNLEKKYLKNKKKFKFIVISSMNETDVRLQKINLLFEQNNIKNVYELDTLCENFKTNFNPNEIDVFKKLGKTFKAFNEIQLISNKEELKEYLKEKKKKYLYKMISFYKNGGKKEKFNINLSEEDIMNTSEDNYIKFFSFKINYKYSKDEILQLIKFIPFRFFNITENNDKYIV